MGSDERGSRLAKLVEKALRPLIEPLGARIEHLENIEIDPYGPRIVIQLSSLGNVETVFIDASPDGVEAVYTIRIEKGLNKNRVEEEISNTIEYSEELQGIEEYDVAYDPDEGELTITLRARMIAELPTIQELRRIVDEAVSKII